MDRDIEKLSFKIHPDKSPERGICGNSGKEDMI
jgi:hypothetical protein